jgi:colanic acid/amylovoran biosynthesis glycosyltransferase
MPSSSRYHLAYVFERFPTFTQTFCVREVTELKRLGLRPMLFSIRDTRDEPLDEHFPPELIESVHFLPPRDELVKLVKGWKAKDELPQEALLTLRHWGDVSDKNRVYEAIYVGMKMAETGVGHAHSHFAGVGARCCYWMKQFFGHSYSFTGHANDLFEKTEFEVTLARLMQEAALVVTVSDYTAKWLGENFPKQRGKVRRVYNGLDLEPFENAAADAPDGQREGLMVSVGRLIEKKGFDDLVRACAKLKEIQGAPFRCVIVGDGPMEEELRVLIGELGVDGEVELAGAKNQPEIIKLLSEAQVFVLPCVTEKAGGKDNLPTVIMEAMAARLPCVSTRLAGIPEMVIEGETGLLSDERKPEDFAAAMASMLGDRDLCSRMGAAGQLRARALFAKEKTAASLRGHLVAHGKVGFDLGLVTRAPALGCGYLAQWGRRLLRKFHAGKPSRFALAEKAAKRAREQGDVV